MTLDEVITYVREIAKRKRRAINFESKDNIDDDIKTSCLKCAEKHEQLAELLEELKAFRESKWTDIYIKRGYNKAIDDFAEQFNIVIDEKCGTDTNNYFRKIVKEVAEQLKVGGVNE